MGLVPSKAYDGDPFIDAVRILPERELIFWMQKFLWVRNTCICTGLSGDFGCNSGQAQRFVGWAITRTDTPPGCSLGAR